MEDTPLPEERRASDIKLSAIEKKLDEHSISLGKISETIQQIALQNLQIQSILAQMAEVRGDVNELYKRIEIITTFQAQCPRKNINALWGVILTSLLGIVGFFTAHILRIGGDR
jgi:CII-binding regulator of phage lambda lysogenization HflD